MPPLPTATLRLTYRARGRVHLPSPPANVWRGQLGYYLHRLASAEQHEQDLSLYQRLFRTPRSAVGVPEYEGHVLGSIGLAGEHVPHPFILRQSDPGPPAEALRLSPGDQASVDMILLGGTVRYLPQLTAAFEVIGDDGLGRKVEQPGGSRDRGPVTLTEASLDIQGVTLGLYDGTEWALPPTCGPELYEKARALAPTAAPADGAEGDPAEALSVRFRTPTRLKHGGGVVRPEALTPDALAAPLYRRAVGMAVCYGQAAPSAAQINDIQDGFRALADKTTLDKREVTWTADHRYSHRQNRRHPAGGLTGLLRVQAPPEARVLWAQWLRRAERIHLGKTTSMGLGRVSVE